MRSAAAVAFAHLTLDDSLARLVTAAQGNQQTMLQSRAGAAQAYAGGQAYRDRDFAFAANKALEELVEAAKEEAADRLQDTLNKLSLLIGFVPIVGTLASVALDLVNASISLARGNYEEAAFYGLAALPIVGDAAQGVRLGAQLARKAGGATTRQAARGVKTGATQLTKHTDSVLGRATHRCVLGNSFTAGTGVVTGVAADGGLLTTDIATLAVGDVVLTNDELIPGGDPHYALVTGVSHRTVYALHHVSYITDAGESETLETTDNHEFYARRLTGQAGWLKAQDLQPGDQLLTPDGTWATVTNNTLQLAPAGITVYNLTVSDGSTYYVDDGQGDASAVWVHNKSACKLAKNLINAGIARADDTIPHHLVARGLFKNRLRDGGFDAALENQRILQKYEIDLDDAVNGVFLDISIHKVERTAYILEVSKRLKIADRTGEREEVIAALKKIGEDLQSGVLKL